MMVHFEVVLRPKFNSKDPYQVLGCHPSATKEELMTAYRNLSWRYHPQNRPDDPEAMAIFVRLSEAYYALVLSDAETGGRKKSALTPREATNVYERRFGRFTRLYYNNGGIVGLPYGFVLKEQLPIEGSHWGLECGRIKLGFFRAFRLKLKMDWILAILEVLLTGGTIGACKCPLYFCARFLRFSSVSFPFPHHQFSGTLYYLALDESYEWYIDLIGGGGILLSSCLLSFWYGFTKYPMILEHDFASWLRGENQRKDMDDIRDVCSEYFHGDVSCRRRSQTMALFLCAPILVLDQLTSSAAVMLFSLVLIPARLAFGISSRVESFFWGLAKSVGAIISALLYYSIWIMGNDIAKFCVVSILLVNQALYSSILCRMNALEFLLTVIFRGVFCVILTDQKSSDESLRVDVETGNADTEVVTNELNDEATSNYKSIVASLEIDDATKVGEEAIVLGQKSESGSTKASSNSSENDDTVTPGCSPFSSFALPGSRGPKSIDFSGGIYSARAGDQSVESNSLADTFPSLPTIFQDIKRKLEMGFMAAMGPSMTSKENHGGIPSFIRSGTEVSSLSRDQSYLQMSAMTEDANLAKMGDFGAPPSILDPSDTNPGESHIDDQESIAIVGDIESSRDLTNFRDPRVAESTAFPDAMDRSSNSDLATVSIHMSPEGGQRPGGNVFQATTEAIDENEAPPPAYASTSNKGQRQSILEMLFPSSASNSTSADHSVKEKASLSKTASLPDITSKTSDSKNVVIVPEHVNMMRKVGSVDEEDLTLVGFDSPTTPDRPPPRGRRPAPGKVDLPSEHQFVF